MLNLLECTPIAQFALGLDHRITFWNKTCELLTGFTAGEMVGTGGQWRPFYDRKRPVLADLIIDDDFPSFQELYRGKDPARSRIVPHAWEASDYFPALGGKPRHVYFLAAPLFDGQGRIVGAIETLQDISEQKQLALYLASESEKLRRENVLLKSTINERYRFGAIVGRSARMQEIYELILKAAATDNNVIVYGESGTGKELVAKAVHEKSGRSGQEFVVVNCGAVPENLFESEFFGHRKGAFTGAHTDKPGYLDLADGGTLFLDEVGELTPNMQVKLLRAIEGGGYLPVGGSRPRKADVRIIAATNRDLAARVKKGALREDFFYRIHIIPIELPSLRARREDIPLLIDHFLEEIEAVGGAAPALSWQQREFLYHYAWPGNVRELQNVLRRFATLGQLDFLQAAPGPGPAPETCGAKIELPEGTTELQPALDHFERELLLANLTQRQWHRGRTAAALGISRKTLYRKMRQHGLE